MIKWPILIAVIVLLSIVQTSFLHIFELLRLYLNIILILIVLIVFTIGYRRGIFIAIVAGLTLDLFSPFLYGTITIALIVPIFIIYLLFKKLLARKSLYSLVVSIVLYTVVYHGILILLTTIPWWLGWTELNLQLEFRYVLNIIIQTVIHTTVIAVIYLFMKSISSRFRINFFINERV